MKKTLRKVLPVLALVLVVAVASVGGTIAWLTDKTQEVTNTFTVGDINITLTETGTIDNAKQYKIIPGTNLDKDPKVKVLSGSENCWLFVKVTEVNWPKTDKISYSVDSQWTKLNETVTTTEMDAEGNVVKTIKTTIYYMDISDDTKKNVDYSVLNGDKVTVADTLSKEEANAISTGDNAPSLTFKAYAIQKENTGTVAEAWTKLNATTTPTT